MTTKNPRINVTLDKNFASILSKLAKTEHKSVSSLMRELALEALDMREDLNLSLLADKLDKENIKTYSHEDAWK